MAGSETLGASFTIDTTNLKAGLAQANRLIRESESEFKAAAAGMEDWTKSSDGINAKIKQLNNTTDLQRKKVDALQKQYSDLISKGLDPTSKQAVELRTKINNETTALNKNEKELKQQTAALQNLGNESEDAAKSTDDLADSTKSTGSGFAGLKGSAGIAVAAIAAVAAAAIAGVKALLDLAESTRETRTAMSRLETGFTTAGHSAEDATNTYKTLYGVLGDADRASEAAGHLALLADNTQDLEKWTDIATGVYAQFGDSLPIEGLTEAANETAKVGDVTGVLADALNWAGVNEEDFQEKLDECSTEQERQQLITETLNGLYADQSEKFKELNKDIIAANEAQADLTQAQADLGAAMEPLNTKLTEFKTNIIENVTPTLTLLADDFTAVFNGVSGSTQKLSTDITNTFNNILTDLSTKLPEYGQKGIDIITSLMNGISEMLPQLLPMAVTGITNLATTITSEENLDKMWESGEKLFSSLGEGLKKAIPILLKSIPTIVGNIAKKFAEDPLYFINTGVEFIGDIISGLWQGLKDMFSQIPDMVKDIADTFINEGLPKLKEAGKELIGGLKDGMLSVAGGIWGGFKGVGNSIVNGAKSFFGIKSPSRLFREKVGVFMGEGLALGIGDGFAKKIQGVNHSIVRSMNIEPQMRVSAQGIINGETGAARGIVVNQYNTYSQAHSRYELFKSKQQTAAAVRLAMAGGV